MYDTDGILLIIDEVQAGTFRTGEFEHRTFMKLIII